MEFNCKFFKNILQFKLRQIFQNNISQNNNIISQKIFLKELSKSVLEPDFVDIFLYRRSYSASPFRQ